MSVAVGGSAASACARAEAKLRHVCEVGGWAGAQQATHDTTHPAGAEAAEHQGAGGRARTRHGGTSSREPERQRAGVQLKDYAVVKVVRSWCTWA